MNSKYRYAMKDFELQPGITSNHWEEEIGRPLAMTNDDIIKNLKRMIKNFPTGSIPHMADSEKAMSFLKNDFQKQKIKLFQAKQTKNDKLREKLVKGAEEMI